MKPDVDQAPPIADYGIIGDLRTCALVSKTGSIDWCCFPRFDSPAVFSRLLDWENGGHYTVAPRGGVCSGRRYLDGTNILETSFTAPGGKATLTGFMSIDASDKKGAPQRIVRRLRCTEGSVDFDLICKPRFDYGTIVPHVELHDHQIGFAHGGGQAISLYASLPLEVTEDTLLCNGTLRAGDEFWAAVTYEGGYHNAAAAVHQRVLADELRNTTRFWEQWSSICHYDGPYREIVLRSAITLKTLTYEPSGAMVAAATTSLPEQIGGPRNWDYRFTWIRDATLALYALFILGYRREAVAFKEWLDWTTVGRARDLQPLYAIGGERRLAEYELPELAGYRGSQPVRIGNGAAGQFQLDIYGELLDSAHQYRMFGGEMEPDYWTFLQRVANFICDHWQEPDDGFWESRGGRQHFVISKVMCWVGLDRAIRAAKKLGLEGDVERWRAARSAIKAEVLDRGFDADRNTFVQYYGSANLDAATLLLPLVGFLPADDPRILGTVAAIEKDLVSKDGYVYRYQGFDDGLEGGEGAFLICTFWLADCLIAIGERDRAQAVFDRCLRASNDLSLFSEEYDPRTGEMLGNFPQAFSHLALINTAVQLGKASSQEARGQARG